MLVLRDVATYIWDYIDALLFGGGICLGFVVSGGLTLDVALDAAMRGYTEANPTPPVLHWMVMLRSARKSEISILGGQISRFWLAQLPVLGFSGQLLRLTRS